MKIHPEEVALARAYVKAVPLESLSKEQMKQILDRGRVLYGWFKEHPNLHCSINLAVLSLLLAADFLVLMRLPGVFLTPGREDSVGWVLLASLVCAGLHSWLLYSLSVFSVHEGSAHKIIFPPRGPATRLLGFVANNICRIAATEPRYYSENHMSHHNRFGTEEDGEFLSFVRPRRFWLTLLPFASFINWSDFVSHRPLRYTPSRILSGLTALSYHLTYAYFMAQSFGALYPILAFVLFLPHVGFFLDRLRQFTEHNLLPLENKDGSRSFGFGFWGQLIGGGPWGSPCHWEHHLVASLPWYQQLILHRHVVKVLTPEQRRQFLLEPGVGYPKLLWRLWTEPNDFMRRATL